MNYEPLLEGIAKFIGATGKVAEESAAKGAKSTPGYTPVDVERWLGPLSAPEKQVPVIHDYLRGHSALAEAKATGATHIRDISLPVWETAQTRLQQSVDADPEVQQALKNMYMGRATPKDKDVTAVEVKPQTPDPEPVSVEVPKDTPTMPQAKVKRVPSGLNEVQKKQQAEVWNDFAVAVESQDQPHIDEALERIKALHPDTEPANPAGTAVQTPGWQRAMNYMGDLEEQIAMMRQSNVQNEDWTRGIELWRKQQNIADVPMPKHVRDTVTRFEAWADAQKPPSPVDRFTQALGVPRAVMSSADLSAPGRQGLLMISRPEYWNSLKPMIDSWSPEKYVENQKYIQNHPDYETAREAGLALTDLHSKLAPREEAFQSQLAERIPILGPIVKSSEQAYTTFLNRLRFDVFSNSLKEAAAAGLDVTDGKFTRDLAEWVNTSTGRGGNFNPGVLSTILFSPRLAISRFQTFNPFYYYKLHPFVRQQALKSNLAAAGLVFSLVSLAGLSGARVTWDFRNPDAGKIRIGNTRLDLAGGHLQFIRLFTQILTNSKVNSETGKVSELGSKFGAATRLDLVTQFLVSKEAPIPSLVTDWLRGKDLGGKKFDLTNEMISRTVPLAVQDLYDVMSDKGVEGLFYAIPAAVGVGVQTYAATPSKEYVPFIGVRGEVPPEKAAEFAKIMELADAKATTEALLKSKNMNPLAAKAVLSAYLKAERLKARIVWIKANRDAFVKAKLAGEKITPLQAPEAP